MLTNKARSLPPLLGQYLVEGEEVNFTTPVGVGKVPVKKAIGAAVGVAIATLGTFTVVMQPRRFFLAVTNRRLLLIDPSQVTQNAIRELAAEIPTENLTLRRRRTILPVTVGLGLERKYEMLQGGSPILTLTFAMSWRGGARNLEQALDVSS